MKPIVGIAGYNLYKEEFPALYSDMDVASKPIIDKLNQAGALSVILPLSRAQQAKDYIERVDALILIGGADVDPLLYQEEPKIKIGVIETDRDEFELALIAEAWKQKKPILGICRGLQILNVAFGGTLYQDLAYYPKHEVNHRQPTPWKFPTHSIQVDESSFLGKIFKEKQLINSYHHQAIKDLADVFKPIAWSKDGLIEAIESVDSSQKVVAFQWHPEILADTILENKYIFDEFVQLIKMN